MQRGSPALSLTSPAERSWSERESTLLGGAAAPLAARAQQAGEVLRVGKVFQVNEKDRAWDDSKLTPQPNGVALQPIKLTGAREKVAKKAYIRAPKYPQLACRVESDTRP